MALPEPKSIPEFRDVDRRRFDDEIRLLGQPAVLRGLGAGWPAVKAAKQSDELLIEYLKRLRIARPVSLIVGDPEIQGRFFYKNDMKSLNFGKGTSPLDPFLDRLLRDRTNPRPFAIALQSLPTPDLLPGFAEENSIELLDRSVVPRMWMGNAARVAAHFDLMENIGVVVAGRRRFTLFPPDQIANLYVGPLELTPAGTPISLVDLADPDLDRFPRFAQAMETAQSAELRPGDAIYIPYHWWHAVDSLEPVNLFVNYWWDRSPSGIGNPYDALMFGLYALRNLPPEQREVWRTVFDHYVFQTNGNPVEHLPRDVQGVLGEANPQQLERMRATLRQILASI